MPRHLPGRPRRAALALALAVAPLTALHGVAAVSGALAPNTVTRGYQEDQRQVERVLHRAREVTVLSLGNSHALAVDMPTLGEPGHHLWRSGGDLHEAAHIGRVVAPRLPRLRLVLVEASLLGLELDNAALPDGPGRRRMMYASLPSWRSLPGDVHVLGAAKVQRVLPTDFVARPDHWRGVVVKAFGGRSGVPAFLRDADGQAYRPGYAQCSSPGPRRLGAHAVVTAAEHARRRAAWREAGREDRTSAADALGVLVREMHARGVVVVLYTAPVSEAYRTALPSEAISRSRAQWRRLASTSGVPYFDHSAERTVQDPALFLNSDHLNLCGARRYTGLLKGSLAKSGLLGGR